MKLVIVMVLLHQTMKLHKYQESDSDQFSNTLSILRVKGNK
jgi:hypothetical protein